MATCDSHWSVSDICVLSLTSLWSHKLAERFMNNIRLQCCFCKPRPYLRAGNLKVVQRDMALISYSNQSLVLCCPLALCAWRVRLITELPIAIGITRWCSWLRHCARNRKVAGSIPDGVTGIFHWHNTSGRTMALGLTQPLTEMSTRNIYWG